MTKTKHAKPEEHHLGTIREQKKEIRRLQQRVKQLERELNYSPQKEAKEKVLRAEAPKCSDCGKGDEIENTLVGRKYFTCSVCTYRSPAVKIKCRRKKTIKK